MTVVHSQVQIDAPVDKVWRTLADLGSIDKWNPGVAKSYATSEATQGEGATRHCDLQSGNAQLDNAQLEERAFDWREGEGFKIDVYKSSLPLKRNIISFEVEPSGDGTLAKVTADYQLKYGPIGALVDILIGRRQSQRSFDELLAGLKYHVETGELVQGQVPAAATA